MKDQDPPTAILPEAGGVFRGRIKTPPLPSSRRLVVCFGEGGHNVIKDNVMFMGIETTLNLWLFML